MKTLNRNLAEKKHSRTTFSDENLWSYFGSNFDNQTNSSRNENLRSDRQSTMQNDRRLSANRNPRLVRNRECTFIVDWQIDKLM
jgi:hypothetical protein